MNMQNLGVKESLGVEFKDGICAELCLKLWFQSNWYFCILLLLSRDGFEIDCTEIKLQKIFS